MGYMHYWNRAQNFDRAGFLKAVEDIGYVCNILAQRGVILCGPLGTGKPEFSDNTIAFNGQRECGHRYIDLGKPFPSRIAEGVFATTDVIAPGEPWYSGPYLLTRACGGKCSSAPFIVDRNYLVRSWERPDKGLYACNCQTDFKPYDLAVTCSLMRLKERLGDQILIWSDGHDFGFNDAKRVCRELFGLPRYFELETMEPPLAFSGEAP